MKNLNSINICWLIEDLTVSQDRGSRAWLVDHVPGSFTGAGTQVHPRGTSNTVSLFNSNNLMTTT